MKFKAGDKVRVLENAPGIHRDTVGEVNVVRKVLFDGWVQLASGFSYPEEMLEPIEDPLAKKILERNNKPETLKELTEPLDLIDSHKRICKQLNKVYADKNHDYGNSFGATYEKYGDISALVRISDKMNRIEQLVQTGEQKVKDEALEDSILDMANYLMMWAMELEREED